MSVGANISYKRSPRSIKNFWKLMTFAALGSGRNVNEKFCMKAGAPANNTAADNPNALYDICYDYTNQRIYICTAFTANASATTWTRIV